MPYRNKWRCNVRRGRARHEPDKVVNKETSSFILADYKIAAALPSQPLKTESGTRNSFSGIDRLSHNGGSIGNSGPEFGHIGQSRAIGLLVVRCVC